MNETFRGVAVCGHSHNNAQIAIRSALLINMLLPTISAIATAVMADTAAAKTWFSRANIQEAKKLCPGGLPPAVCEAAAPPSAHSSNIGTFTIPTPALVIQERLRTSARESLLQGQGLGASPDVVGLGKGFSAFASSGAEALYHYNNKYEDGYNSRIPNVTIGGDYQVTDWLVAGAAFNYFNFAGDYDDGGRFNTNSFGPILYVSLVPFQGAFADINFEYAHNDYYRRREGFINSNTPGVPNVSGSQSGGTSGNRYGTSILLGYDYPIQSFTIGPRIGLNYIYTQIKDYREHGTTGLELRYSDQDTSSLQSSLGIFATYAVSTQFGTLLPQVSASWVHDYGVGGGTNHASFVAAAAPSGFDFKLENVGQNYATIGIGMSALLPNNLQPFVNFKTVQGSEYLVSYGGTLGLRVGL